jgi:hypothetical protein
MAQATALTRLRQLLMIFILFCVSLSTYLTRSRSTDWDQPLWVAVYPINGDGSEQTDKYIDALSRKSFASLEKFMATEATRYGVDIALPARIDVGVPIESLPPLPEPDANPLSVALWSLRIRWWAWRVTSNQPGPRPDIKLFLVYHDPDTHPELAHSLGLQKGMLGICNVFSDRAMAGSNKVVVAHEMLHTLGASDKYAGVDSLPVFPIGYAEPERDPLYPQRYAEIMGGRVPVSAHQANIPTGLRSVRIGAATALEINWTETLNTQLASSSL